MPESYLRALPFVLQVARPLDAIASCSVCERPLRQL